ncbi:isochorismate synthase [Amycolatopsis anabasis]|uniref:isochorismate synthase n=1 Tax=Amycolatopsis anabasis TaxID=1840409 RepID=UPI001FE89D4F|nr:isochorismate synthase [Amycolatopsis anabasis]
MTDDVRPFVPARLLSQYVPGDFFLATEQRTILGSGAAQTFTDVDAVRLSERVSAVLAESATPFAVGALPFDTTGKPGHVVVPESLHIAGPAHPEAAALSTADIPAPIGVVPVPDPGKHADAVAHAVTALEQRRMRKVVLARALDLEFAEDVAAQAILHNLLRENPHGYTFAAALPGGRTLMGASPELLLSRRGDRVVSHPHAGSAPRSADPVRDKENGRALEASRKDQAEHAVLIEALVETLRPFCRKLDVPAGPSLVCTPAVWHLRTTVTGELIDRDVTALRLAAALHPTPAICGSPTGTARELVGELEPFDRGYYAGTVGWVDAAGDGEWVVSIRCAEVAEQAMRLYAGGGIMPASDPWSEVAETTAKFRTLLGAMGLELED